MIRLEQNQYFLLDFTTEVFTRFDTIDQLMRQLVTRRRTGHLVVQVVKKDRARLLPVDNDLLGFNQKLQKVMGEL